MRGVCVVGGLLVLPGGRRGVCQLLCDVEQHVWRVLLPSCDVPQPFWTWRVSSACFVARWQALLPRETTKLAY